MGKANDPFEEFRRKKEMEKLQKTVRMKKDKPEKKDTFDGFHISSFFKQAKKDKEKKKEEGT